MNYSNSNQMQQMQRLKEQQQLKQLEKLNELENKFGQEKIRESVIRPIKIESNNKDVQAKYNVSGKDYENKRNQYWDKRTNQPYKNIIKDERHINKFLNKKNINEKELIVHRVTDADKEGVDEEFTELKGKLEKHNNELKVIYSTSHELEHKKKFEYNNKYKYRIKYNPSSHNKLKKDKISYYKREQKKMENDKEKVDVIIESLINKGIFEKSELEDIGANFDSDNRSSSSENSETSNRSMNSNRSVSSNDKKEKYRLRQSKKNIIV
jgi:hypothetical protein